LSPGSARGSRACLRNELFPKTSTRAACAPRDFRGDEIMLSKYKLICVLTITLAVLTAPLSARGDDKQKKKKKAEPQPVTIILPAPPPPPRPANGSLFSDYAPGYELLADFIAGRVGDLVFVDVIETSAASVSSGA